MVVWEVTCINPINVLRQQFVPTSATNLMVPAWLLSYHYGWLRLFAFKSSPIAKPSAGPLGLVKLTSAMVDMFDMLQSTSRRKERILGAIHDYSGGTFDDM